MPSHNTEPIELRSLPQRPQSTFYRGGTVEETLRMAAAVVPPPGQLNIWRTVNLGPPPVEVPLTPREIKKAKYLANLVGIVGFITIFPGFFYYFGYFDKKMEKIARGSSKHTNSKFWCMTGALILVVAAAVFALFMILLQEDARLDKAGAAPRG